MKTNLIFHPIDVWPRPPTAPRRRSPFKMTFEKTLRILRAELGRLDASTAIVQAGFSEREISSATGLPRADRRPGHPGIIVAADTKYGALKWACDACVDWTDNVHAVALTLERLRLADLYGVTRRGEQYSGWKMLPGPITAVGAAPTMSIDAAARYVAGMIPSATSAAILSSRKEWERVKRAAVKSGVHPDHGGTPETWAKFTDASTLLDSLHNRKGEI